MEPAADPLGAATAAAARIWSRSISLGTRRISLGARANSPAGDKNLVFRTRMGTALSAGNVRRDFRAVLDDAGLTGRE